MDEVPTSGDAFAADVPERIGPYRIVQILGEGGMGVVYEAEQTEPVRRRVALKMMKVGMDTAEVVRRFESERQALAVMDHAGIAKVFDAGATEAGRPYFVMELVDGVRLDDFCDRERLAIRERAELFITICEAIQHAHLKGVIHRDLKPSNVLVTKTAGRVSAKIIDFGIAKATGQSLTRETVVTTYGQAIGTLAYMSPEQADASGLDVDTRSDVYSLGVVLYELLAGVVPLSPKEMGAWPFLAHLMQPEQTVPTPLRRLIALSEPDRARLAASRRTDLRRLEIDLDSDVQWIVLKAIEKDRGRRYETAEALAADLRRFLAHQAVTAHPPSRSYRLRKFVRRNRPMVAMAALLTVLSIVYVMSMTLQVRLVAEERDRAAQEAETAQQTARFMTNLFAVSNPSESRGRTITALEILERGTERITTELVDQPAVQQRLLSVLGDVHTNLGLYNEAERLLLAGVEAAREGSVTPDITVASSLQQLAWLYQAADRHDEALPLVRRAMEIVEENVGTRSWQYANSLQLLGMVQRDQGELRDARLALEGAIEIRRQVLGPEHVDVGWGLSHLGWLAYLEGDLDLARETYEQAIAILDDSLPSDDPVRGGAYNDMAVVLHGLGDLDGALAMHERVLALREHALGVDHPDVAGTLDNLANVHWEKGEHATALEQREQALSIRQRTFGPEHPTVALNLNNIGLELQALGRYSEAVEMYGESIRIHELAGGVEALGLASPLHNLGWLYRRLGRIDRARPLLERALAIREHSQGTEHLDLVPGLVGLGYLDLAQGRPHQAVARLERALAVSRQVLGADAPRANVLLGDLGAVLLLAGQPEGALEALEDARSRLASNDSPSPDVAVTLHWLLGKAHRALGDTVASRVALGRALEMIRLDEGERSSAFAEYQMRYQVLEGDLDQGIQWLEQLLERGYADAEILTDADLEALRRHPRFGELTSHIRQAVDATP